MQLRVLRMERQDKMETLLHYNATQYCQRVKLYGSFEIFFWDPHILETSLNVM